jgi:hypothetical protein
LIGGQDTLKKNPNDVGALASMTEEMYRCEREDLFEKLKNQNWFNNFIRYQYENVVFKMEAVAPVLSDYWILQAYLRWNKDVLYASSKEYEGAPLDHFKYSGFLCYWLRRCPPMSDLQENFDTNFAGIKHRKPNEILIRYGNVFAAFDIGLRICRYWESARKDLRHSSEMRQKIMRFSIPQKSGYSFDMSYVLAEKNVSPHALNMVYKSLFLSLRPS